MRPDLLALAAELTRRGTPFAVATVVRREPPSSAHTGDSALITADGAFHGWLGGSCTQPTVLREAQRAIAGGQPRLIALSPDPNPAPRPGIMPLPMTCHSGGHVDVYIEPVLPAPQLVVFGVSPTARALARIAAVLGYAVTAVDPEADDTAFPEARDVLTDYAELARTRRDDPAARTAAVVATLGVRDEEALRHALGLAPAYVGLVASRKRFGEMRELLQARGVAARALDAVHCPAGLDVGARTPEEIALSVMVEIVQLARTAPPPVPDSAPAPAPGPDIVTLDPVCHMTVEPATAKHRAEYGGRTYLFCSGGCREQFLAAPARYAADARSSGART